MGAPHKIKTDVKWITDSSGNVAGYQNELGAFTHIPSVLSNTKSKPRSLLIGDSQVALGSVHPNLWAQYSATALCVDDPKVLDLSGNERHAVRGAQLSIANMNSAPGYFKTLLASSNGDDPALLLPSINYDLNGGEFLFIWALFKMSAPASDGHILANSASSSANGFRLRAKSTGYIDFSIYSTTGAVASFSGNSINALLDNTLHSVAVGLNGKTGVGSMWEDEVLTRATLNFTTPCDTRESAPLRIGASVTTPTVIAHTSANQLRGMVIMRWTAADETPALADLTALQNKLRRDPGRVVSISDA